MIRLQHDQYLVNGFGRTVLTTTRSRWWLLNGTNVNHKLVKEGCCWWYREYVPDNSEIERLEQDSRDANKELCADPEPTPLWLWRKQ